MGDRPPWLTDEELADICKPLVQGAAQRRYLKSMGLTVREKPDGSPLVMRSNVEAVLGPDALGSKKRTKPEPDRDGLRLAHCRR